MMDNAEKYREQYIKGLLTLMLEGGILGGRPVEHPSLFGSRLEGITAGYRIAQLRELARRRDDD